MALMEFTWMAVRAGYKYKIIPLPIYPVQILLDYFLTLPKLLQQITIPSITAMAFM